MKHFSALKMICLHSAPAFHYVTGGNVQHSICDFSKITPNWCISQLEVA